VSEAGSARGRIVSVVPCIPRKRGSTIELEIYTGLVQFISCLYVLPVIPFQMKRVGYIEEESIACTSIACAVG
jgi:xanthine/uracil/vitamin C permease (AzgA family)